MSERGERDGHVEASLRLAADVFVAVWSAIIVSAAIFSFYASARSLQIGEGVPVIAVTSVAANLSTIVAGLAVFDDPLGGNAFIIVVRIAAFALILVGAALIPAPVRVILLTTDQTAFDNLPGVGQGRRHSAGPRALGQCAIMVLSLPRIAVSANRRETFDVPLRM